MMAVLTFCTKMTHSMAMVVGLLAKKRVISTIPPGGKKCGLPQDAVEHLQDLVISHKRVFGD
jgi:hypothetical protein